MSISHSLTWSGASSTGSAGITGSQVEVGGSETAINQQFAAGLTNQAFSVAFATAGLQSIFLVSNKNMTIKVNSTTSPILTLNLIAGAPFIWDVSPGYWANPFSADVTTFYVTTTAAVTLKGLILKA